MPESLPCQASHDGLAETYREDGFVVVEDLFDDTELRALEADLIRLARGGYPTPRLKPVPGTVTDADALKRILCIHMPHVVSPTIRHYTTHRGLAQVLGQVVGAHLRPGYWNGGVKCMQSMFFAKPPGKPGQAWHQDEAFIPTRDRSLCGAWIAIDDATVDNGCLRVLPGSHRDGVLYPFKDHDAPEAFDVTPESYGFDASREIAVEMRRGSVLFFNGYLLHRSLPNTSERYRRALVCHYMSTQSPLHWSLDEALEGGGKHESDNRSVHIVCGDDPYVHLGYTTPADAVYLRAYDDTGEAS